MIANIIEDLRDIINHLDFGDETSTLEEIKQKLEVAIEDLEKFEAENDEFEEGFYSLEDNY